MANIKWTYALVKEYVESLGYELISEEYINIEIKISIKDKDGYFYLVRLSDLHKSKPKKFYISNPYTIDNIKLWLILNDKNFELISETYKGSHNKLKFKCLKETCEDVFEYNWNDLLTKDLICPSCSGQKVTISNCLATKNLQLSLEWHPIKNGDLTPYNVTSNSGIKVWWQCKNNSKHEWVMDIKSRNRGNGCPYCSGLYASEDYNLLKDNLKLCEEWNYEKNDKKPEDYTPNSKFKVWWKCKKCDYEWFTMIQSRNGKGCGCPKCAESKGEKQLDIILTKYNIPHDSQYKFNDLVGIGGGLLRFDAPVFWDEEKTQLRMLIEYDGIFHYEKQYDDDGFETLQIHDELKNQYCKNNNIKLLRIPYWEFNNIEEILIRELNLNDIKLAI